MHENGGSAIEDNVIEAEKAEKFPLWAKIIVALSLAFCLSMVGFIAGVIFSLMGNIFLGSFIPAISAVVIVLSLLLLFCRRRKLLWRLLGIVLLASALIITGKGIYDKHISSLTVVRSSDVYIWDYTPFLYGGPILEDGQEYPIVNPVLAQLPGEPSLKFGEEDYLPRLDGATALLPIYSAFAAATYPMADYDVTDIKNSLVACATTAPAYEKLIDGDADIIFVAAPSQKQLDAAEEKGVELILTPIGKEAFVFFVNDQNKVDGLSTAEIRRIYGGEITNWNQVGGKNQKIRAFQRDEGSGSQSALLRLMEGHPLMEPPTEDVVYGMGGIVNRTADYRNFNDAIGFSFRYYVTSMLGDGGIKLLSIDGVYPSAESIRDESYPLSNVLYAVTLEDPHENAQALIDWILSDEGQQIVEEAGYVGIK